jgi:hypothetical protein
MRIPLLRGGILVPVLLRWVLVHAHSSQLLRWMLVPVLLAWTLLAEEVVQQHQ